MQKEKTIDELIEENNIEQETLSKDKVDTSVVKIGDKATTANLNKFDVFFIRIWAFMCSVVLKLTNWICKGLGFVFKKEIPKKYVTATVATILIILIIAIVTAPFSVNVTNIEELSLYNNKLIAVQKLTGKDAAGNNVYKWGYANKNGDIKIDCEYDAALEFKYGVAFVKKTETKNGTTVSYWQLINKRGKRVGEIDITQNGDQIPVQEFSKDTKLARVQLANRYGYMDTRGRIKIEAIYDDAGIFSEGIARVVDGRNVYFINKKGKKISQNYENARDIVNGRAAVATDSGRWGFINSKGETVVEARWDSVSDYYNGYAAVQLGSTYGIIDINGKQVVKVGLFQSLNVLEYFGVNS